MEATQETVQHTLGPWAVRDGSCHAHQVIGPDGWGVVADCGIGVRGDETNAANARLIAAAPALLAALEDAVLGMDYAATVLQAPDNCHFRETIVEARAAIRAATGSA